MHDDGPWWLNLPPCSRCGESHVLITCAERLPLEVRSER